MLEAMQAAWQLPEGYEDWIAGVPQVPGSADEVTAGRVGQGLATCGLCL